jgi:hypothetical protein
MNQIGAAPNCSPFFANFCAKIALPREFARPVAQRCLTDNFKRILAVELIQLCEIAQPAYREACPGSGNIFDRGTGDRRCLD